MENFGDYLKNQREKKGIRLEEIASITKIHLHSLEFLEASQWAQLPPEPFIRGFIIAYAKYVGLDTKDTLERYAMEVGKRRFHGPGEATVITTELSAETVSAPHENVEEVAHKKEQNAQEVLENPPTFPVKKAAYIGIAVAGLIVVLSLISIGKKSTQEPVAQVEEPRTTASSEVVPPPTASATTAEVQPQVAVAPPTPPALQEKVVEKAPETPVVNPEFKHEVTIEGKERSWMKVVIDEKAPVELYLKPNEKLSYQAKEKIKLVIGNSTQATVMHNGEANEGKKYQGTIRFYIFPKGARFPQDQPKRATTTETPAENSDTNTGSVEEKSSDN